MGHQTTLLRDMYQKLWLGENLPYYLGNILARYDEELSALEGSFGPNPRQQENL